MNKTTVIKIDCNPTFKKKKVSIEFQRASDYVQTIKYGGVDEWEENILKWFDLDELLLLKNSTMVIDQSKNDIFDILKHYTKALKDYAEDILTGDFSILPILIDIGIKNI